MTDKQKSWFAKYWWLVTIVPIVFIAAFFMIKFILIYITANIGIPDLSNLERDFHEDQRRMDIEERDVLDKIIRERDELWRKIDEGTPTPGEIFDGEILDG